jgi:hypothetical protein
MSIRPCVKQDLESVARLHKAAFTDVQVPALLYHTSASVIKRFYSECLDDCIFLVSEENGNINGLVLGGEQTALAAARRRFYRKNAHRFLPLLALRPMDLLEKLSKWRNFFIGTTMDRGIQRLEEPWIMLLLAVSNAERGSGLAARMWNAFETAIAVHTSRFEFAVGKANKSSLNFFIKREVKVIRKTDDAFQFLREISV